jgi:dTDP-4-amino-4,6-dideoxygalactose transaminase
VIGIPLVDLAIQHRAIADVVTAGFDAVMASGAYVKGPQVAEFELSYAAWSGVRHCVGVGNGTDALELALRGVGVEPGNEVILPANTFIATAEAVVRIGATPVLVDVDDQHLLIDPDAVPAAVTDRSAAVVPVHLFGQVAPMERLLHAAAVAGLAVVEDAAQAHGATRHGRPAGTFGAAAGTSFYPGKNLGAYGDAGAVLTDSDETARAVRLMADHGSAVRYQHSVLGWNSRLDTLQAVVLSAKLAHLARWNDERRAAASLYGSMLDEVDGVVVPRVLEGNEHVWHLYVVRVPDRDEVLQRMQANGIGVGIHYPVPLHLQPAFGQLGHCTGDFPVAEAAASQILSLPIYPGIVPAQQERVVEELAKAMV